MQFVAAAAYAATATAVTVPRYAPPTRCCPFCRAVWSRLRVVGDVQLAGGIGDAAHVDEVLCVCVRARHLVRCEALYGGATLRYTLLGAFAAHAPAASLFYD
jgi:hypothetical protein